MPDLGEEPPVHQDVPQGVRCPREHVESELRPPVLLLEQHRQRRKQARDPVHRLVVAAGELSVRADDALRIFLCFLSFLIFSLFIGFFPLFRFFCNAGKRTTYGLATFAAAIGRRQRATCTCPQARLV